MSRAARRNITAINQPNTVKAKPCSSPKPSLKAKQFKDFIDKQLEDANFPKHKWKKTEVCTDGEEIDRDRLDLRVMQ